MKTIWETVNVSAHGSQESLINVNRDQEGPIKVWSIYKKEAGVFIAAEHQIHWFMISFKTQLELKKKTDPIKHAVVDLCLISHRA